MKRKLFSVVCLVIALALMISLVACDDKPETFRVSADFDSAQGSVVISDSDGNVKANFKSGEQAVITVSANDEYSVDSFKVNDDESPLDNGVYAFNVRKNTVIKVTFKKNGGAPISADALDSVKTTFKVSGSYVYTAEGENPDINNITTVFGTSAVNLIETSLSGEINYDDVYVDIDGKLAMPYHTLDNRIEYLYPSNDELFEDYGNPFKALTVSDFASTDEDNVFELIGAEKRKSAATAITGYNESIASFIITVEDGKVTGIDITTERIKRGSGATEYYYTAIYSLSVSDWNEADVDVEKLSPYKTTDAHTALANALAAAFSAKNYTLGVYEVEPYSSYEDVEYNTYVTESAIYIDCVGWEEGYVEMGENVKVVYPFDYEPETGLVKLYDPNKNFPTLRSMRASFNAFNDFAPEVFEYETNDDGTVTYALHYDVNSVENVRSILINFADGIDVIRLYAGYTYNVAITLKDGALYQITLDYLVGDAYVIRTVTYSDFDNTVIPISFDNCEKVSVLDEYIGTYTDGKITAVIDKDGIKINGLDYEITDYSVQYDMFTGIWNGGEWVLARLSAKQLAMLNIEDDITYILTSTAIDPVDIPAEFEGVWSKDGTTTAIAYDRIEFNGAMLRVLSYDEEDGLYATNGEYTYRFLARELTDDTPVLWVIVYDEGMSTANYVLHKDEDAVLIPEIFVGTWEKDDYQYGYYNIVIGLTSVRITIDNIAQSVTLKSVELVSGGWSDAWTLTVEMNGKEYTISEGYTDESIFFDREEERFSITLNRVDDGDVQPPAPSIDVPESFYGTYSGEKDGTTYVITISANGIVVTINGVEYIATVTDYDSGWDVITMDIDGEAYYITPYYQDNTMIDFSNENYTIYITLAPDASDGEEIPTPGVDIPEKFCGTYTGSNNDDDYSIVISSAGISVTINGDSKVVVIEEYDDYEGFTVTIDGDEFFIMQEGYSDDITAIRLMSGDYRTVNFVLNREA